ncbi:MAG: hypothetical protein JWQ04_419 [Pedosphaera sp.]|nr:hypothetical protein [Pedosphaera sp.]
MHKQFYLLAGMVFFGISAMAAELPVAAHFRADIQPILTEYCFDCHADGANKGGVAFDEFKSEESLVTNRNLWLAALKNLRAGLMPPEKKPRPTAAEIRRIEDWIKYDAFSLDPKNPDPGRVTLRRLNRVEYRNTIRDLMGMDYDTNEEFPADDTGYGFDNIGDVLTLSPMLFEKYLDAAKTIVAKTVPTVSLVVVEKTIPGHAFNRDNGDDGRKTLRLSYYDHASVSNTFHVEHAGRYQLVLDMAANEKFVDEQFDYNKCRLIFKADGQELLRREFIREGDRPFHFEFNREWPAGDHQLTFEVEPLAPNEKQARSLSLRIDSVTVRGPLDEKYQVPPKNYARFFTKDAPKNTAERRVYARQLLGAFATKAFRHPADDATVDRLTNLAEGFYKQRGQTFEAGIAHAMTAVLASPQFLFREENIEPNQPPGTQPFVDEYALASRLSYFLWSSMPDDELFRLAATKQLRQNLPAQVKRMLADYRSDALVHNFAGQWLQARDIDTVNIDARSVLDREETQDPEIVRMKARLRELRSRPREELNAEETKEYKEIRTKLFGDGGFRPPRVELGGELRQAMRHEVESYLGHIIHEDRSVRELIDSDYTYLNERLARHYGLTNLNIAGSELRLVKLPAGSPRGGVLTMGSVLAVTSNPTRTSPVKRGLFILENVLGTPSPPPPPNIPPLEDSEKAVAGRQPTLREVLAIHREKPLCASCHNRMDPLGLALENFNAMGMWREKERDQDIEAAGKLITGEKFNNIRELKHILATDHHLDFYRTFTGKMLTYALGRGLEYYDVETVDQIVDSLEKQDGRFSALLTGIIESAPFQKRRESATVPVNKTSGQIQQRAELK